MWLVSAYKNMDYYDVCVDACHNRDFPTFLTYYTPDMGHVFKTVNGVNLLHRLSEKGFPQFILHMISVDPTLNLNQRCYSDMTPLMYACMNGHLSTVQLLIKHGVRVKSTIQEECIITGYTAMGLAIHYRHDSIVKYMLDTRYVRKQYEYPDMNIVELEISTKRNRLDMVKLLLSYEFMKSRYSLMRCVHLAIKNKQLSMLKLLFQHIDIHDFSDVEHPLMTVVFHRWVDGLDYILSLKPNLHKKISYGTVLHFAVDGNQIQMVRKILDADVHNTLLNEPNEFGKLPLTIACRKGYVDIVELLLQHGANPNDQYYDKTILMESIIWGNDIRICVLLIQYGADISTEIDGHTAYCWAAKKLKMGIQILLYETEQVRACSVSTISIILELTLDPSVLMKIMLPSTKQVLSHFIQETEKDACACYTALHEGEHAALTRYRNDEEPRFSTSPLRGLVRPMGLHLLRRNITSYLVHPKKDRDRLLQFRC